MSKNVLHHLLLILGGLLLWAILSVALPLHESSLRSDLEPYLTTLTLDLDIKTLESLQLDQRTLNR